MRLAIQNKFNGVWTRDLAKPVRRSNQLCYKATDFGSWSFVGSNEPVRNECEVIYKMFVKWYMKCFIYWTADLKSTKPWSSQFWTQFKQLLETFHISLHRKLSVYNMQFLACEQAPSEVGKKFGEQSEWERNRLLVGVRASWLGERSNSPGLSRLVPLVLDYTRLSRPKPKREPVRRLCNLLRQSDASVIVWRWGG